MEIKQQLSMYIVENQNKFYRLAYSYVGNPDAAKDVVQNAVVKGLEKANEIRNAKYIGTWFYRVLVNESINYLRQNKKEVPYDYENLLYIEESSSSQTQHEFMVMEKILKLPVHFKTVILLRFYEELSLQEIAQITNVKLSTAKYRLYRALTLLKKQIQEEQK